MSRRCQGDGGAVIVEAALALPVLGVIMLGLLEFGMAWHESIVLDRAMSVAARTGSNMGAGSLADFETLRSLDAALAGLTDSKVKRVVIWEVNSTTGVLPTQCDITPAEGSLSPLGSAAQNCNIYSEAQMQAQTPANFGSGGTCASSDWDKQWCPGTERDNGSSVDYFGLMVELEYDTLTGLMGDTMSIERTAIYAIEPDSAF